MTLNSAIDSSVSATARPVEAPLGAPADRLHAVRSRSWVAPALMLIDVIVIEACIAISFESRLVLEPWLPISLGPVNYLGLAAGVLVLPLVFALLGLYPGYGTSSPERLRRRVTAIAAIFFTLLAWDYLVQGGLWSRGILLLTWGMTTVALPAASAFTTSVLIRRGLWGSPVLVMGPVADARAMIENLTKHPWTGLVPVGYLTDDTVLGDGAIANVPYIGAIAYANTFADRVRMAVVVRPGAIARADILAHLTFPHVILVSRSIGAGGMWVTARDLGGLTGLEVKKNLLIPHNRVLKRMFDFAVTIPLFLFCLPLLAMLCLAVFVISPGNPFYWQLREGKDGRYFRMLKLRTMYRDSERRLDAHLAGDPAARAEWYKFFKLKDDPRILPVVGNFLRRSSLDELPQVVNVLKGEMSLVGPRPFPDYHLEKFSPEFRSLRRSVMPGITGLWQVEARSDGDLAVQEALDTYYIRNWSLWLDIDVMFRTFTAVALARGAR